MLKKYFWNFLCPQVGGDQYSTYIYLRVPITRVLELELHMYKDLKFPPLKSDNALPGHMTNMTNMTYGTYIHQLTVKSQLMYPWYYLVCTFTYFSHTPDFSKPLFVVPPFDCWGQVFHPSQHDCIGVESLFFRSMIVMQNNSVHRRCPR